MRLEKLNATTLRVPSSIEMAGRRHDSHLSVCLVEATADTGETGYGVTLLDGAIEEIGVLSSIVNGVVSPLLVGEEVLRTEQLWQRMYWKLTPRGQGGYALNVMSVVDVALWDLKGRLLSQPTWKLLGGARDRLETYVTFGFPSYDQDELVAAAKHWHGLGFDRLKMVVGSGALRDRGPDRTVDSVVRRDLERIAAVQDALGDGVELYIDANCSLDYPGALRLAKGAEELGVRMFEEPLTQNDVEPLRKLKSQTSLLLAGGQNEGLPYRFRDILVADALDIIQPNVVKGGGFTPCLRIAGLAASFNRDVWNGGAWHPQNAHLLAGVSNGGRVEYHHRTAETLKGIFPDTPVPERGVLPMTQRPGLGLDVGEGVVEELRVA